jgi:hypothetical protein
VLCCCMVYYVSCLHFLFLIDPPPFSMFRIILVSDHVCDHVFLILLFTVSAVLALKAPLCPLNSARTSSTLSLMFFTGHGNLVKWLRLMGGSLDGCASVTRSLSAHCVVASSRVPDHFPSGTLLDATTQCALKERVTEAQPSREPPMRRSHFTKFPCPVKNIRLNVDDVRAELRGQRGALRANTADTVKSRMRNT